MKSQALEALRTKGDFQIQPPISGLTFQMIYQYLIQHDTTLKP